MISPLAYIHPEAKIGENVEIGPFVYIDKNVVIGDNNTVMPNANILYGSRIGNGNTIFPGAVIGAIPQDLKFRGEETTAEIGDNNIIREIARLLDAPIMTTTLPHEAHEDLEYATDPELIDEKFGEIVDLVIDGGIGGIEPSTVVSCTEGSPEIVRQAKGILEEN